MSSSQRPTRRRSARLALDEEEEETRPAKRVKTSAAAPTKQSTARKPATTSKKSQTSYEEEADGFQFSRAKAKKPRAAPTSRTSPSKKTAQPTLQEELKQPPPAPAATKTTNAEKPSRSTTSRGRKLADSELEPPTERDPPRRRSGRLSGDKLESAPPAVTKSKSSSKTTKSKALPKEAKAQPPVEEEKRKAESERKENAVEEPRGPTKISLPFADTPVIQRNKEMRKNSSTARRSSAGMRGRRASSLMDTGMSNALPHSEVETSDFYKHISQDIMEQRRMKQLLVWCGTRVLPERPSGTAENVNAILAARVIQEELLRDFSSRSELSDWFNREDVAPASLIKKPNPRNVQNALKLQELELEVKRLQEEKALWDSVISTNTSLISKETSLDDAQQSNPSPAATSINPALLTPTDAALLHTLSTNTDVVESAIARFQHATTGLELNIDTLADGVHRVKKLTEAVDQLADRVQLDASAALERREVGAAERAGGKTGVGDVLRGLARLG